MNKKNYKDMLLESESGFMMPFSLLEDEELPITLGYGKQKNPATGEDFDHKGIDFAIQNKPLYAIASGIVIGMGWVFSTLIDVASLRCSLAYLDAWKSTN